MVVCMIILQGLSPGNPPRNLVFCMIILQGLWLSPGNPPENPGRILVIILVSSTHQEDFDSRLPVLSTLPPGPKGFLTRKAKHETNRKKQQTNKQKKPANKQTNQKVFCVEKQNTFLNKSNSFLIQISGDMDPWGGEAGKPRQLKKESEDRASNGRFARN